MQVLPVWIVVPAFNEAESLQEFVPQIVTELLKVDAQGRLVVVDDGSNDGTREVLAGLRERYPSLLVEHMGRNRGKARALQRGFRTAVDGGAEVIVMMDADGQDDPTALPALLAEIAAGKDLVTGARVVRRDRFIKRVTSTLYNRVTTWVGGAPGSDHNSGFKAFRRAVALDLEPMMYGELHRYITVIAFWSGYRLADVAVPHHPRQFGSSKYGPSRFWRGFLDLITVRFLLNYEGRPLHLFGGVGFGLSALGGLILLYLIGVHFGGVSIGDRPLLQAGILLVLAGLQLLLFGLLAELLVYASNRNLSAGEQRRIQEG